MCWFALVDSAVADGRCALQAHAGGCAMSPQPPRHRLRTLRDHRCILCCLFPWGILGHGVILFTWGSKNKHRQDHSKTITSTMLSHKYLAFKKQRLEAPTHAMPTTELIETNRRLRTHDVDARLPRPASTISARTKKKKKTRKSTPQHRVVV